MPTRDITARKETSRGGKAPSVDKRLVLRDKTYLAKGKRGIAYTAKLDGKTVLVKERNPESSVDTVAHEATLLQQVNERGIGPLFIALQDGALIREYVDGPEILEWIAGARKAEIKRVLAEIVQQCRALDELGVNKLEMTHPHKHILVRHGAPVFIDFDRARVAARPKNVTQVCQWLTGGELSKVLSDRGIMLPRDAMLAHARSYKQTYGRPAYERILEVIENA